MTVEIFNCEQGSIEWHETKLGIPSASNFSDVMATGEGKVRSKYLRVLAGETVCGIPRETYRNAAMERGKMMEADIRNLYALVANVEPEQIGFVKRTMMVGFAGCSPDAFVGADGVLEIKSAAPDILIEIMKAGRVPPEHLPQCQGAMLVTGRSFCDLAIGYSGMPLFHRRIKRDPAYIARLETAIETFNEDLAELVAWVRAYGKE